MLSWSGWILRARGPTAIRSPMPDRLTPSGGRSPASPCLYRFDEAPAEEVRSDVWEAVWRYDFLEPEGYVFRGQFDER